MCLQEYILRYSRHILNPERLFPTRFLFLQVAANHYRQRRVLCHTRIGRGIGYLLQQGFVSHHYEMPRLRVHCRRSRHTSAQQLLYLGGINGFVLVRTHRGAGEYILIYHIGGIGGFPCVLHAYQTYGKYDDGDG